jgi:hypothetical protein
VLITIRGTAIINIIKRLIIKCIINEITKNGQKFLAEELKNAEELNLILSFLKPLNSPPVRKTFIIKPTNIMNIMPAEKKETIKLRVSPRSVKTSVLNPSASFSVIMLLPKAPFRPPLRGIANKDTRMKVRNQVIKILLHDFNELLVPDIIELRIFISGGSRKKQYL